MDLMWTLTNKKKCVKKYMLKFVVSISNIQIQLFLNNPKWVNESFESNQ